MPDAHPIYSVKLSQAYYTRGNFSCMLRVWEMNLMCHLCGEPSYERDEGWGMRNGSGCRLAATICFLSQFITYRLVFLRF